jgi:photosystem II stability/assembly factor-like uncharacterized protein
MKTPVGVSWLLAMDRRICTFFLASLIAALVLAWTSAHAQTWVPVGPPGGTVRALASDPRDPQRIYLGTGDGILYRSDDGGLQWHRLDPGFPQRGMSLDDIVVDGRGVVFIGYWQVHGSGGGVARSTNGGQTFAVLKGVDGESVRSLAIAPSDARLIAAGTLTGVFLSRDRGQSWARITPESHPDLRNIESLAFDPVDPQIIYAGTWHLGWKTLDGGATWVPMHRGMIDDSDVMTLTIDRWHPQDIYATACTGIYRSTENASEWTKLEGIPFSSRRTRAFAQSADDKKVLLAGTTEGLWISENSGGTWSRVTPKELVVNALVTLPNGTIVLGAEGAGVLRSSDRGRTWTSGNTGFSERFVSKMLFDSAGHRLLVAVWGDPHYGGVFATQGARGAWIRLGEGLGGRQVLSLALMGETILAGTDDGIFARTPEATAWTRLPTLVEGREVHPRVTELLALPPHRLLASTSNGMLRSRDQGRTWTQPTLGNAGEVSGLAVSPRDPDRVVAATQLGFFRSKDGGDTWRQVSCGLDGAMPHALAFVPSDDRVLFATTTGGLFRSGDQGATWRRVSGGIPHSDLTGIAVQSDGRTIYASDFTWGGIFRSVDGGSRWDRMPTDGLASDRVWTLGLDPTSSERLLAASSGGGLHLLVSTTMASRTAP